MVSQGTTETLEKLDWIITSLEALQRLYVGSASGVTLSDLAARCVTRPVVLEQLSAEAAAKGWNADRQAYWTALKGRTARADT